MTDSDIITSTETAHGAYRVRLEYDPDAPDPRRDYDHHGTLLLWIRGRDLPLEGALVTEVDAAMERGGFRLAAAYLRIVHSVPVVLPVWGYDHGGLTVGADDRVGQPAGPRDSGPAGLIYMTPEQVAAGRPSQDTAVTADELAAVLRAEVAEYDAWLSGEVYGYVVEHATDADAEHWRELDSCWGHVGYQWAAQAATEALAATVLHAAGEHARRRAEAAADLEEIASMRRAELGA